MSQELDRFLTLFDALVDSNNAWLAGTPKEEHDWTPFHNENMKFGDRISVITMKSVYIHTIVGEHLWSRILNDCADGASLKFERDEVVALSHRLTTASDLVGEAMALHKRNMNNFTSYTDGQLAKTIEWSGRKWTVMGFLWGIYAHRCYHLGNIDILMREGNHKAPDFFSNFRAVMA